MVAVGTGLPPPIDQTSTLPVDQSSQPIKLGTGAKIFGQAPTPQGTANQGLSTLGSQVQGKTIDDLYNSMTVLPSKVALQQQVAEAYGYQSRISDLDKQTFDSYKALTAPASDIFSNPNLSDADKMAQFQGRQKVYLDRVGQISNYQMQLKNELSDVTDKEYNRLQAQNQATSNAINYLKDKTQTGFQQEQLNLQKQGQAFNQGIQSQQLGLQKQAQAFAERPQFTKDQTTGQWVNTTSNVRPDLQHLQSGASPEDLLNVPDGSVIPTRLSATTNPSGGKECAEYINDITHLGMGDSYASKLDKTNVKVMSSSTQAPEGTGVGNVAVWNPNPSSPKWSKFGHAGVIVGEDGDNWLIKSSNMHGDGAVTTDKVPKSNIEGYNTDVNVSGAISGTKQGQGLEYGQYGLLANTDYNPKDALDTNAKFYMDSILKNGTVPNTRTFKGVPLATVEQRAQDLYYKATGSEMPDVTILKANKQLINGNNKLLNNLNIQEGTINQNFKLAIDNIDKAGINQYAPFINSWINNMKDQVLGDPDTAAYLAQNKTLQNEAGSLLALKNASGTTVADKLEAAGLIPANASEAQQKEVLKKLMQEAENGRGAVQQTSAELYKQVDPLEMSPDNPNRKAKLSQGQSGAEQNKSVAPQAEQGMNFSNNRYSNIISGRVNK